MSKRKDERPQRNAGAFLSPDPFGMIAVPSRTLSDELKGEPPEPEDSDRVPEPDPPGLARRVLDTIKRRQKP
jgi:hypothetical protein